MRLAAFRRRFVDREWIFRRPDAFGKIRLSFHGREIQVGPVSMKWCAKPERGEQISRDRRVSVAVPMDPRSLIDVPNKSEFNRCIRLRPIQQTRREKTKRVVASGTRSRWTFFRGRIGD